MASNIYHKWTLDYFQNNDHPAHNQNDSNIVRPIYNTVSKQTDYYIDGEIRDTLSTHVASDHGCETIISSWTHTPYHWHDEVGSLIHYGLPAICTQAIYLLIQQKIGIFIRHRWRIRAISKLVCFPFLIFHSLHFTFLFFTFITSVLPFIHFNTCFYSL